MTDWIKWEGGPCPVAHDVLVDVACDFQHPFSGGGVDFLRTPAGEWEAKGGWAKGGLISRYRLSAPKEEAKKSVWVVVQPQATQYASREEAQARAEKMAREQGGQWYIAPLAGCVSMVPSWVENEVPK